jgi:hypothetical protein
MLAGICLSGLLLVISVCSWLLAYSSLQVYDPIAAPDASWAFFAFVFLGGITFAGSMGTASEVWRYYRRG